jgi:hypothetical protein
VTALLELNIAWLTFENLQTTSMCRRRVALYIMENVAFLVLKEVIARIVLNQDENSKIHRVANLKKEF